LTDTLPHSPQTPEARRRHAVQAGQKAGRFDWHDTGSRTLEVVRRVAIGVSNDGVLHAGNLAYLTILTVFPFFILMAAATQMVGRPDENLALLRSALATLPPAVAALLEGVAREVLLARTGPLLWFGAVVGLWTVSGFIETIRDILRRAYGTRPSRAFWHSRLASLLLSFASVFLLLAALAAQLAVTAIEELAVRFIPHSARLISLEVSWLSTSFAVFCSVSVIFWTLAPSAYRARDYPKWPGALVAALWWTGALALLPPALSLFGDYALTYGSLAGVIIALLFFWIVGFGLVIGAHLNAALANPARKEPRRTKNKTEGKT
jgi:membrane protein